MFFPQEYAPKALTFTEGEMQVKDSTKIAKEALETGRGVYELVLEHGILSKKDLDTILKPENMIKPVKLDIKSNK